MELPLAKPKPISDDKQQLCDNILTRGGETAVQQQLQLKRGVRICKRKNSANTKVTEEGGRGGALNTRVEITLQPVTKTTLRKTIPLQLMEVHSVLDSHLQPKGGPRVGAYVCLRKVVIPWGAFTGSWQDLW